jgi:GTP-binding protein
MFLDEVTIYVKGGDGGNGIVAFRREKYVPLGGPAGGDGGKGGDIYLVVNAKLTTLSRFERKRQFRAESGKSGGNFNKTGANGPDLSIDVPPGTIVRDEGTGVLMADLTQPGQKALIARGGRGGRGNARFKSPTNQAPRMAEKGAPGEERWLLLELKLLADVGIVGVPNAGKSTLLSVISAARPKIAPYPFTTLSPNLGVVYLGDMEMVFADIPGLVEGAHMGIGLGHDFLRHIQRTRVLVHLLDGAGEDPIGDFVQITSELALFDPDLLEKPQLVVLNKMDLPQAQERWPTVAAEIERYGHRTFAISAATHEGVDDLVKTVAQTLVELPPPPPLEEIPTFRLEEDEEAFEIVREGQALRVVGKRIEQAAAMTYWEYEEAVMRFQRILEALGITDALREAGIEPGDTVFIGDHELEWME